MGYNPLSPIIEDGNLHKLHKKPGLMPGSADWQSAASRIGNPPAARNPDHRCFAD